METTVYTHIWSIFFTPKLKANQKLGIDLYMDNRCVITMTGFEWGLLTPTVVYSHLEELTASHLVKLLAQNIRLKKPFSPDQFPG